MSPFRARCFSIRRIVTGALALLAVAAAVPYLALRGSLAAIDGELAMRGLAAPVTIERDALGVPTISGANRADVAFATGFVHAQDRFFQMDLSRRAAAGRLAELVGDAALPVDRRNRPLDLITNVSRSVSSALDPSFPAAQATVIITIIRP